MTVYVDTLQHWGWILHGQAVQSCHMFTDSQDLQELHAMALHIGLKREWFQDHPDHPHYDVTSSRRAAAVHLGAKEVTSREMIHITRLRNERIE